jgi:hypothetical protein
VQYAEIEKHRGETVNIHVLIAGTVDRDFPAESRSQLAARPDRRRGARAQHVLWGSDRRVHVDRFGNTSPKIESLLAYGGLHGFRRSPTQRSCSNAEKKQADPITVADRG